MKRLCFLILFLVLQISAQGQTDPKDSLSIPGIVDTLFIDHELKNWSFRFLTNIRDLRYRFNHENEDIGYVPTDRLGLGFGIASKKIIIDFNFALNSDKSHRTDMFNLLGTAVMGNHVVDLFFQDFNGYYQNNRETGETQFREDANSLLMGFFYTHHLMHSNFSITSLRSGLEKQKKSTLSPSVGGFLFYDRLRVDSSFIGFEQGVPELDRIRSLGLGGSVGMSAMIVLPHNFFIALSVMPSVGIFSKVVDGPNAKTREGNPLLFMLNTSTTLGYNGESIYINLSITNNRTNAEIPYDTRVYRSQFNAKLAIGYKLFWKSAKKF